MKSHKTHRRDAANVVNKHGNRYAEVRCLARQLVTPRHGAGACAILHDWQFRHIIVRTVKVRRVQIVRAKPCRKKDRGVEDPQGCSAGTSPNQRPKHQPEQRMSTAAGPGTPQCRTLVDGRGSGDSAGLGRLPSTCMHI